MGPGDNDKGQRDRGTSHGLHALVGQSATETIMGGCR
jgi:hypothetical protein